MTKEISCRIFPSTNKNQVKTTRFFSRKENVPTRVQVPDKLEDEIVFFRKWFIENKKKTFFFQREKTRKGGGRRKKNNKQKNQRNYSFFCSLSKERFTKIVVRKIELDVSNQVTLNQNTSLLLSWFRLIMQLSIQYNFTFQDPRRSKKTIQSPN